MAVRELSYRDAIKEALFEEMRRDPNVFCIGEDIARFGGPMKVTEGLLQEFGEERVVDTPIAEAGFVGIGVGAAMTGLRPVVEVMYNDFLLLAMDQIINQAAKASYMFGGKCKMPIVVRTHAGAGRGNAAQHSQSLWMLFVHLPGVIVMAPSTPADAKGLLKSAIRADSPTLFFENKLIYGMKGPVPEGEHLVPIGKADIKRRGKDVTIVSTSRMTVFALGAAEKLAAEGIDVEIVDPRTLKPLDLDTVLESVRKTKRVVIVDEGCRTGGFTAEVAARIMDEALDYLDAPMARVATEDTPIPYCRKLELEAFPQERDIIAAVKKLA
ncbi:MAG: alpha-ketoacid dehydrogenase subunit beta [Planctomycetes bacterium]|nr:alpha-ketoacid dehydrogenase subunit beta [Planctomycetota bacterium]